MKSLDCTGESSSISCRLCRRSLTGPICDPDDEETAQHRESQPEAKRCNEHSTLGSSMRSFRHAASA